MPTKHADPHLNIWNRHSSYYYHARWLHAINCLTVFSTNFSVDGGFNETAMRTAFSQLRYFVKTLNYAGNVTIEMQQFQLAMRQFDYTVESMMLKIMEPCSSFILDCDVLNKNVPCSQIFLVSKTSEGFCCSFNYKLLFNYKAYTNKNLSELYGFRISGAGQYNGIKLLLASKIEGYVSTIRPSPGILLAIHPQEEYGDFNRITSLRPAGGLFNYIYATMVSSDETVRRLPKYRRKCRFETESPVKFTDKYSVASCVADCRVRHYIALCNCIPFYYPHLALPEYASIEQCNFEHLPCLYEIRAKISTFRPPENAIGFHEISNKSLLGIDCPECAPTCDHIIYESIAMPSQASSRFESTKLGTSADNLGITTTKNRDSMTLFIGYYENNFTFLRRSVFMTWDILFANIGGSFGLCLGASLISFIEVVYFLVVRVFGRICVKKPNRRIQPNQPQIMTIQQFARMYRKNNQFGGFIR